MSDSWNFNIEEAHRGNWVEKQISIKGKISSKRVFEPTKCLVATKCGKRFISCILDSGRWLGLATDELPLAWSEIPPHPASLSSSQSEGTQSLIKAGE